MEEKVIKRKVGKNKIQRRNDWIFILSIVLWPIICWCTLYLGSMGNQFIITFQNFDPQTNTFYWSGFNNITDFVNDCFNDPELSVAMGNSMILYFINLLIDMPVAIIVAYCIYKKVWGAGFFKVVLLLPSMISSIIWVLIFKYFVEFGLPRVLNDPSMPSLITTYNTAFGTMIFYSEWIGLAGNLILYTGAMSRVPVSLVEYGKLDGLGALKELWHLTIPLIFPTITVFLVTGIVGIFTSSNAAYSFYGQSAPLSVYTSGYYFFCKVFHATTYAEFPYVAASSTVFTIVATPITLFVKYMLEKYGPNVEY
jgi:ABC-type sugar transport system permease subunit